MRLTDPVPGHGAGEMTFDQRRPETIVWILTMDGHTVITMMTNTEGSAVSDISTDDGNPVSSEIYLAMIKKTARSKP